ncbi:DUF4328 domain-containing protein [Rhodococcus sp. NPDC058521]|uniref:DUF4328 domain-containing protein n=1 Tax=Rhodococcus sp. NPDC058521 TaxID=3346536 RepID=UPI00366A35D1
MLLAPIQTKTHLRPERRGFRWIARTPLRRPALRSDTAGRSPETPRYSEIPRWGLRDAPPKPVSKNADRFEQMADLAGYMLVLTAIVYALAAVAELGRYVILLVNRSRLIDPLVLAVSDISVFVLQASGMFVALVAAVTSVFWLLRARRRVFESSRTTDPRNPVEIAIGCAVPIVNLVMPGVFLLELVRRDPRAVLLIRIWWVAWVCGAALVCFNWLWRTREGLQAMADGVLLAASTAAFASAIAVLTLAVLRRLENRTLRGRGDKRTRWVLAA